MANIINAITTGGGGISTTADASGSIQFATNNGTTAMTIDTSQNVGIGTTSPTQKLQVAGNISQTGSGYLVQEDGTNTVYWTLNPFTIANSFGVGTAQSIPFIIGNNNTERMRIDSVGALLVNVTANLGNSATKMNVAFDQSLGPGFVIKNNSGSYNTNASIAFINASNGNAGYIILTNATTTAYVTTSDYRLKENIAPMTGALDKVLQLKPVTYKWKVDGSDGQGFIAHELQAVVPDAVSGEKDAVETYTDEEGNEQTRIKPQGVDTSFLVATLTAAIQEQQTIINELKSRIEVLEGAK